MEQITELVKWMLMHGPMILEHLEVAILALIAIFMLVPGEQPEKALQAVINVIKRFSRK
jgi:hypothetical protein